MKYVWRLAFHDGTGAVNQKFPARSMKGNHLRLNGMAPVWIQKNPYR